MFSDEFIKRILQAEKVAVLTGAGISAESGVPTFRGEHGIWRKLRPEELASMDAFMKNPTLVWEWYDFRRKLISDVEPNPGHYSLAELEGKIPRFSLITQNVDNLHRVAGSRNIYELHGNIMRNRCVDCNKFTEEVKLTEPEKIPRCECGGMIRPDVVWYGEMLPEKTLQDAFWAASNCDVFLSVGTSALVQPAASLPIEAKRNGAFVIEINTEPTVISKYLDETIIGKSGEVLPQLLEYFK